MALNFVTSINPSGVGLYVEDAIAGKPTSTDLLVGSVVINVAENPARYFACTATAVYAEIPTLFGASSGLPSAAVWLPITLTASGGGGTQSVTMREAWRVVDFYITNSSGGVGGGSVRVDVDGSAVTDALVPGAADAITRAATLVYSASAVDAGHSIDFVKAAGFTASRGWVRLEPR